MCLQVRSVCARSCDQNVLSHELRSKCVHTGCDQNVLTRVAIDREESFKTSTGSSLCPLAERIVARSRDAEAISNHDNESEDEEAETTSTPAVTPTTTTTPSHNSNSKRNTSPPPAIQEQPPATSSPSSSQATISSSSLWAAPAPLPEITPEWTPSPNSCQ